MSARHASHDHNAVMLAMDYISRHLADKIQLRDLSTAAGVSQRTLGYMFRRALGATPMAFVKWERINKARDLLEQADPTTQTVTRIAHRCGFTHLGQFACDYKRTVGELPSQTLKQPPGRI